jgi:CHAD domain-containing protein
MICGDGEGQNGLPAAAVRPHPITLSAAMTAADAFPVIARACMAQFRLNEAIVCARHDPAALHQARVALRRLRSAFSIHRAMLTDAGSLALAAEVRWLAGELGKARDLDVLVGRLGKGPLRDHLVGVQAEAHAGAVAALQSARARTLMADLAQWLAGGAWRWQPVRPGPLALPARKVAARALDRYRRKVRKSGRHLARLDDAALHEVRKAGKKLLYAADFFASLFDRTGEQRQRRRFVRVLEKLQDQLGAINDLATMPAVLARHGLADHPQAAALFGTGKRRRLRAAAAASHDDLIAAKRFWR